MSVKPGLPRDIRPELEHEHARSPDLGYESSSDVGFVRCLSHGFPTPLARWHYHDEYELHLITSTSGKVFVGDWIGPFGPGQLVLTGPRLPHNWVSLDVPEGGVEQRDLVIQFSHEPLARAADTIPELREVLPLLERAKNGIEFFGLSERATTHWQRVKTSRGLRRITAFCDYLADLAACTDYRLLSSVQLQSDGDDASIAQIHAVVSRITDNIAEPITLAGVAAELGMSESRFSRFFRRATGNTFVDFVNRVRIHRACQLLMESDRLITHICYEVGFNNVANFNRRFLEVKGMTPSDFRKQSANRFSGST
ncbi:AraC family transcriptional regulator [Aquabacterium sp. OR-4]|uniref:AraC family transcriptional regulator n=1 Tax=Aquabacterium sp. OR-4 TaxID=2978127 RepID=UPI0021B3BE84|nr:AraC family transcriptional regulator [Aquabacterium sp. OR-4]MDT7838248.1 AraC family transcriptional regulator [Aquabacterium sp. OR-4]